MPNFSCARTRPPSCVGEGLREGDRVAFDGDVDVEAPLAEQDVAHGAADEVDPLERLGDRGDRFEHLLQPLEPPELVGQHRAGALCGRRLLSERAEKVAAGDDADDLLAAQDSDPLVAGGEEALQLGQRRRLDAGGDPRAHDPLHRRMREAVPDGAVEVLAADDAFRADARSPTRIPLWP